MRGAPANWCAWGDRTLTEALGERIVKLIPSGLQRAQLALMCGVSPETLEGWLRAGLRPGAPKLYADFVNAYAVAEVELEALLLKRLVAAGVTKHWTQTSVEMSQEDASLKPGDRLKETEKKMRQRGDWRALAWYLERRWPDRWSLDGTAPHRSALREASIFQLLKDDPADFTADGLASVLRDAAMVPVLRDAVLAAHVELRQLLGPAAG